MADRIEVNPERLRQAVKLVDDLLDMFCRRTGLDSWQILGEEKLPDDAELSLSAHDIYNVVDMLHDAQTALAFAPGIPPFTILAP